jgi:hypothetical protein
VFLLGYAMSMQIKKQYKCKFNNRPDQGTPWNVCLQASIESLTAMGNTGSPQYIGMLNQGTKWHCLSVQSKPQAQSQF